MKEKKSSIKDWLHIGIRQEGFAKKMFAMVVTLYIIYRLGYGVGTFLSHIGL